MQHWQPPKLPHKPPAGSMAVEAILICVVAGLVLAGFWFGAIALANAFFASLPPYILP